MVPIVLTVAGSDPSGGAGLQADLKTTHGHGAYGAAVATLLTVQNTEGVTDVELLSPALVAAQLRAVLDDMSPAAAKTGALGSPEVAHAVGVAMRETSFPWVVDPVWAPTRGSKLGTGDLASAVRAELVPFAALVTPNALEASVLARMPVQTLHDAREAATRIAAQGSAAVLVKGGHLEGADRGTDLLLHEGVFATLEASEARPGEFHGTGCALSAAIATRLAWGASIPEAVKGAKRWLEGALSAAFPVGKGARPVNHLWQVEPKS